MSGAGACAVSVSALFGSPYRTPNGGREGVTCRGGGRVTCRPAVGQKVGSDVASGWKPLVRASRAGHRWSQPVRAGHRWSMLVSMFSVYGPRSKIYYQTQIDCQNTYVRLSSLACEWVYVSCYFLNNM